VIRVYATATYLSKGIRSFSKNWLSLTTQVDVFHFPEIIPDLPDSHNLNFNNFISVQKYEGIDGEIFGIIASLIIFLPSLLYRYSLKSSAWLYLPLIYVVSLPATLRNDTGRGVWLGYRGRRAIDWLGLAFAVIVLATALVALTNWRALATLSQVAFKNGLPVTVLGYLLVLDWHRLEIWHYLSLPSALLAVVLFLWLDHLRRYQQAGGAVDPRGLEVGIAIYASRLRTLLVFGWLALALHGFVGLAHQTCKLPAWSRPALAAIYGSAACAAEAGRPTDATVRTANSYQ
jgi:hypothetical protein